MLGPLTPRAAIGTSLPAFAAAPGPIPATGIGSLMGYVTGLGAGILYGAHRVFTTKVPIPVAGIGLLVVAL